MDLDLELSLKEVIFFIGIFFYMLGLEFFLLYIELMFIEYLVYIME